jgi:anaerobic selenocysteine-containing dehydrogenase
MFLESRRKFLKSSAYGVAGATVVAGVFTNAIAEETAEVTKTASTPKALEFYPPVSEWDSFLELDGNDWKRGGVGRNGVASEDNKDGIEIHDYTIVPTACSNCEAGCGLTAWVDKKTLTVRKYMGNPYHSASRGRNCAKGYGTMSQMYDPDRIPFPLKRAPGSKRGDGKWIRVTWDDAMKEIGAHINKTLKSGDELSKKYIQYQVGRPNENGFGHRVPHTLGIDGYNSHTNICSAGAREGSIQWANDDRNSPDWANAKLIFLQSSHAADAGHYFQQSAGLIADARKNGAKMVVIDPRLSNSAGIADLWISPWPGTEAALYLHLVNRLLTEKNKNGDSYVDHDFVKNWLNWDTLMADEKYLAKMVEYGYIKDAPKEKNYEAFISMLKEVYAPYTKEFTVKECRLEEQEDKLDELFELLVDAGPRVASYLWRAGTIGHRGGWMNTRSGFLVLALIGAMRGDIGGVGWHHWHKISIGRKGDAATVAGKKPGKVDVWNELIWPPEYPLSTYEMSYLLPHHLTDKKWQQKWIDKGLKVPQKIALYMPRMYNPVWINPDGFRWIEALKDEKIVEMSMNLSPTWSETNWFCDFVLPVGLAGERHDQQSEPTKPEQWTAFRQPALRVALEKMKWVPKNINRATLEAHMKAGLGEIWEENEFFMSLLYYHADPDGSLGIKKYWASKTDPSRPVTISEYYDAGFSLLPNLLKAAKKEYPDSRFPCYEYMRDYGAWTENTNVYKPQEKELKIDKEKGTVIAHGHTYKKDEINQDDFGRLYVEHDGNKKVIGIEVDGKFHEGFHTPSKKLDFYCDWLANDWKWPEYAIPIYPRSEGEQEKMIHIVTQVHHKFMKKDNEFALNTIYRLPYNIHTRSVNSKHLMEISQNHNPVWIYTKDAEKLGIKKGDAIKVRIVQTLNDMESGYFIAMAVPTEATRPGVLACSHHAGRWKLKNAVDVPGFKHKLGVMGLGSPLYDMSMDGKVGTLKPKEGIKPMHKPWQFTEYNKDTDNIWWDGLTGSWQNAVAPVQPDPIAGNHAWHQKVIIEKAGEDDKIGDIYVNYDVNMQIYRTWRDELTRPLDENDKLRRPKHINRPAVPLSDKAYSVSIKKS